MRKIAVQIILILLYFTNAFSQSSTQISEDSLNKIRQQEFLKLADPVTGQIPYDELEKATVVLPDLHKTGLLNEIFRLGFTKPLIGDVKKPLPCVATAKTLSAERKYIQLHLTLGNPVLELSHAGFES
jgi:hypothetical protein